MSRELTFTGFLRRYVRQLSVYETNDISKLAQEAYIHNARLQEPLVLYAIFTHKSQVLLEHARKLSLPVSHTEVLRNYTKSDMEQALHQHVEALPLEYHKVCRSYMVAKSRSRADNHTKELIRQKVLYLQNKYSISNYRIYKNLKLHSGNITGWLKYGCSEKVSLSTARRVLNYVEEFPNRQASTQSNNQSQTK